MTSIKTLLNKSILRILSPIIRILLRFEVSHSEFSELAKRAYVNTAYQYFAIPNRKNTFSRVSVLTGLSRKEVVRLSQLDENESVETKGPLNRATRVISGWMRDDDFLDENHQPKVLPLRGDGISFETLATRYSGDITGRAILDELIRVGSVKKNENDCVELIQTAYIPNKSHAELITLVSTHTADLLSTGVHNILTENEDPRFQRQVIYNDIPDHVRDEFEKYSREKSMDLLIELDKWLAEKKKTEKKFANESSGRVGLGIYYFKNENNNTKTK